MTDLQEGKVVNFFGMSVCHCCRFELRIKFLSGTGLAKMNALVPVANSASLLPLCHSANVNSTPVSLEI